jgi:hypothetical protein
VTRVRPLELAALLKRLLRIRRLETEAQGTKLWVDPASNFGTRVLHEGVYEQELTQALQTLLKPGQTFVDVGANEGWFTVLVGVRFGRGFRCCWRRGRRLSSATRS